MAEAPVAAVEQGRLRGRLASTPAGRAYHAFQGIPYAKPPLGSLRFKAPQPHEPWEGIRDATSEGNESAQIEPMFAKSYIGDENCLFLNVYTPNVEDSNLPVFVYIHGGGLIWGSGNTDLYGPDYLIEKDVIVVTVNYRLGVLGFLSLNTPEVPGNAGLKDVVLALKWVKANIKNFGGNPDNLTLVGESAGGSIVSLLTASPLSKNLISRAIIMSGTALFSWFFQENPIDNARKLALALGFEGESANEYLEFLSSTPAREIVEAHRKMTSFEDIILALHPPFTVGAVVEKEFPGVESVINEAFIDLLTSGRVAQVPIMIGTTALELSFAEPPEAFQTYIPPELHIKKDSATSLEIAEKIKQLYMTGNPDRNHFEVQSDRFVNIDTHRYVQYLVNSTNIPIYYYRFDYVGELNISHKFGFGIAKNEAQHMDDLGYLFKNDLQKDVEPTPQDLKMRERMVRLWTNFAKTGNPTPEESHYITVSWPPVTKDNIKLLHLGAELTPGPNPDAEKMQFWEDLYNKHYKIWEQPKNEIEICRKEPVIIETLTVVTTESSGGVESVSEVVTTVIETSQVVESSSEVVESSSGVVVNSSGVVSSSGVVESSSGVIKSSSGVIENASKVGVSEVAESASKAVESASEPERSEVDTPKVFENVSEVENQPQLNGNGERKAPKRTSNEIKMVQNSNGVPKDVIRANDPPEDDLPKNIGVNKFVNFFESLGGKK